MGGVLGSGGRGAWSVRLEKRFPVCEMIDT